MGIPMAFALWRRRGKPTAYGESVGICELGHSFPRFGLRPLPILYLSPAKCSAMQPHCSKIRKAV
jgi:hypothetical protein